MPCRAKTTRVDWMPGDAALQALEEIIRLRPGLNRQDAIDYAVITAASALRFRTWQPPQVVGKGRHRWIVAECGPSTGSTQGPPVAVPRELDSDGGY